MNAATAQAPDLADTVIREAAVMRRQVDHHLARARAVGRRASAMRAPPSGKAPRRCCARSSGSTRTSRRLAGDREAQVAIERQDLDEILGNLIENAAKYGGGSVFVTIDRKRGRAGRPGRGRRPRHSRAGARGIFDRGARLDTDKPGTGLGLAIVRDVAEIYGGA